MDAGGAHLSGGPIDQSTPFRCPYCPRQFYYLQAFGHHKSSHRRERSLAPATNTATPLFTGPLLPEINSPDVVLSLRPPVPKIPKEKTKVSGEPKQKRRCLCGMFLPVGSDDSFSDHETSEEKDEVEDDDAGRGGNGYDGDDDTDAGSTANTSDLSNLDLELKI